MKHVINIFKTFIEKLKKSPEQLKESPGQMNEPSKQLSELPEQLNVLPEQLNELPKQLNELPEQLNVLPEQLNVLPEQLNEPPKKLRKIPKPVAIGGVIAVAVLLIGFGVYQIWLNFSTTTIKGIDVSNYQGNISWRAVAENGNAKFVYIKATEGKTYQDPFFEKNWNGAAKNGIPAGAYHFFTMTSTGYDQACNFISMVPKEKGKLPPAVDIESSITKESDFKAQLTDYVQTITKHYGQKPVFYVSNKVYDILYDDYAGYDFWIINYTGNPAVKGWTFWQTSEKGTSAGIDGKIDLDQYKGSRWNFNSLLSK